MNLFEMSESSKNLSDAAKNLYEIFDRIFNLNILNSTIKKSESKIIETLCEKIMEDIKSGKEINQNDLFLLVNFKQTIKEIKNCTDVTELALNNIPDTSKFNDVEEDWFSFYFDKVRLISDRDMQRVWSNILLGEVNKPGKFQKSLVHILSIMNNSLAEDFCNLLRFSLYDYKDYELLHPLIFISQNVEAYADSNITREKLLVLENIGLIQCDLKDEYIFFEKKHFRIGNKKITVYGDKDNDNKIKVGNVVLTSDGQALASICGEEYKKYRSDILDFTLSKLIKRNCQVYVNGKLINS